MYDLEHDLVELILLVLIAVHGLCLFTPRNPGSKGCSSPRPSWHREDHDRASNSQ